MMLRAPTRQSICLITAIAGSALTAMQASVPLTLRTDGTLSGSGNIDVTGRVVTGVTDSVQFASRTARCAVGALAAQ